MKPPSLLHTIQACVVVIAAGSFLISYNNLHQSALLAGIPVLLAWVFPLTIDAFLMACTGYILYSGQKGVSGAEGWFFLIAYTFASIAFNVHMAPPDIWSQAGFAMCPVGLCISLHIMMRILETEHQATEPQLPGTVTDAPVVEEKELTEEQTKVLEYHKDGFRSYRDAGDIIGLSYRKIKDAENILKSRGLL